MTGLAREGGRLVLEFGDDADRNLRADTRARETAVRVLQRDGIRKLGRRQRRQHGESHLCADPLNALQQVEPLPFQGSHEAEELELVLTNIGLDEEHAGLANRAEPGRVRAEQKAT